MSGKRITLASRKGGCGKTTTARVLIAALRLEGLKVAVVDSDPKRDVSLWLEKVRPYADVNWVHEFTPSNLEKLGEQIDAYAEEADVVITDTGGFGSDAMAVAILASDAVIIPCMASADGDAMATIGTAKLVQRARGKDPEFLGYRVLFTQAKARTLIWQHQSKLIQDAGAPRFETTLSDLTAYPAMSLTADDGLPGGRAGAEIAALVAEMRALGWLPPARKEDATPLFTAAGISEAGGVEPIPATISE